MVYNLEFNLFYRILSVCVSEHTLLLIFVVIGENSDATQSRRIPVVTPYERGETATPVMQDVRPERVAPWKSKAFNTKTQQCGPFA